MSTSSHDLFDFLKKANNNISDEYTAADGTDCPLHFFRRKTGKSIDFPDAFIYSVLAIFRQKRAREQTRCRRAGGGLFY